MRRLKRNQKPFIYKLFISETNTVDANGFYDGNHEKTYAEPVETKGCIAFRGTSDFKAYGLEEDYSVQIVPDNPIVGIAPGTIVIIDGVEYVVRSAPTTINEQRIYCK